MFTLIVVLYSGIMAKNNEVAVTSVSGFQTMQSCISAGKAAESLNPPGNIDYRFACVEVK